MGGRGRRKGGRERPNEWLGRVNGWRVTRGCRVWRGATDMKDGRDKRGIGWL